MPEQTVRVADDMGHVMTVTSTGALSTTPVPEGSQFYVYALGDTPGVVAANNFISIFNPVGSGKTITFYSSSIVPWATAATSVTVSLNVFRTTAASGGTLVAASTIPKFYTTFTDSIAEVRIGNPTVTTSGLSLLSSPPAVTAAASGIGASTNTAVPSGSSFACAPGQGIVFRTASGSTAQLWNFQVVWAEL